MEKQVYIHYGATQFDPTKKFPIKNAECFPKPNGGLWASRINATFGWKNWCKEEDFRECVESNSFKFMFKDTANIYIISTVDTLKDLPMISPFPYRMMLSGAYYIDFEACFAKGIDAIELCWYGNEYSDVASGDLYSALYGWDCDSILVLNPESISLIDS